jgi:hypothetical protein
MQLDLNEIIAGDKVIAVMISKLSSPLSPSPLLQICPDLAGSKKEQ